MRAKRALQWILLGLGAVLPALSFAPRSVAADFPAAPVHIVVPNPPGGSADSLPRILAAELGAVWKQPIIVENRAGAAGNVGAAYVSRAPADGLTLLASPATTLAINQSLYKSLDYDPTKLELITIIGSAPNVLISNTKVGSNSVADLIKQAKARPGEINYGSQGIGSTSHLTTALFETTTQVKLNHVPYKGTAPAMTDLLGGHIAFMFDNLASSLAQHKAGTLQILAICTPQRSALIPDVPTMQEQGLPGFFSTAWFGIAAPPGTPPAIIQQIARDMEALLKTDTVRAKFAAQGADVMGLSPEDTRAFVDRERKLWRGVIEAAHIKVEE
jgi:tripartite-type tricarboxylate transporter receptor subunit TctC